MTLNKETKEPTNQFLTFAIIEPRLIREILTVNNHH